MYDPEAHPDPDDPAFIEELREKGLDDEQIEQAQQHLRYIHGLTPEQREAHEQQSNDVSMGRALQPRWGTSRHVRDIEMAAAAADLNRRISDEGLEALDPEGIHLFRPIMIHRYAQGQPVAAHMRCEVWLKMAGQDVSDDLQKTIKETPKIFMDVPMPMFLALPEARDENTHGDWQDEVWRVILGGS